MDKSGDRVHLMFLEFMRNLRDPLQYSWVVVVWPSCIESCVGQARKRHRRLVGRAPWSNIGHGQGCHSCARG